MSSKTSAQRFKSLAVKVPALMVGLTATAILVVGFLAASISGAAFEREAAERMDALREARGAAVETWFKGQADDLVALAGNPATAGALANFTLGWADLGESDAERRDYLHTHYIRENRFKAGERNQLERAFDGSTWSEMHGVYHAGFEKLRQVKGLYDIFLVDPQGNIVYTVFKEDDLGENLVTGRLADSGLAEAVGKVLAGSLGPHPVALSDFSPYAPSYGAQAAFMATPVLARNGRLEGVVAFQLPVDRLTAIMTESTGLGETGHAYLVGPDGFMRSASRAFGEEAIGTMEAEGPQIAGALAGETTVGITAGHDGVEAEVAAGPIDLFGLRYAVVVEQDLDELLAPLHNLTRQMTLAALAALAIGSLLCILFARSISRPLGALSQGILRLSDRNWNTQFDGIGRQDEIGTIARGLKKLRYDLASADAAAQEAHFKSAALGRTSSGVMIANGAFEITYVNDALRRMIEANIDRFRSLAPDLTAENVIGRSMDVFHKNPERIRAVLSDPSRLPMKADIELGSVTFALDISNVTAPDGTPLGFVVEWADATIDRRNRRVVDLLRSAFSRLSDGDLTITLADGFEGDYVTLRDDFNAAIRKLGDAIATVVDTSITIKGEAQEISSAADNLARRTEQQAATLEETAAALDELTSSVSSAAASAKEANRIVSAARNEAEESGKVVREAVQAMHQIDATSAQVSQIISVIEEIAFQTNLLALNAGVEAARAGDAGRGFAVVASEVRALARRASDAAKEIGGLIKGSTQEVKRGVTLVEKAGEALGRIVGSVQDIDGRVSDIAQSAQEQASGLGEINIAVNQLDQVTQQNAAMFEEMSAASSSLNSESQALMDRTTIFAVPDRATAPAQAAPAAKQAFTSVRGGAGAPRPAAAQPKKAAAAGGQRRMPEVSDDWDEF